MSSPLGRHGDIPFRVSSSISYSAREETKKQYTNKQYSARTGIEGRGGEVQTRGIRKTGKNEVERRLMTKESSISRETPQPPHHQLLRCPPTHAQRGLR